MEPPRTRVSVAVLSWLVELAARLTFSTDVFPKATGNYVGVSVVLRGGLWALWLRLWKMAAMTLGSVVCVVDPKWAYDARVMAHEARHVRQQNDEGLLRYGFLYAWDFVTGFVKTGDWRAAYRAVRWEVDARRHAGEE